MARRSAASVHGERSSVDGRSSCEVPRLPAHGRRIARSAGRAVALRGMDGGARGVRWRAICRLRPRRGRSAAASCRPSAGPWRRRRSGWHSRARRRSPPSACVRAASGTARASSTCSRQRHEGRAELAAEQPGASCARSRRRRRPRPRAGMTRRIVEHRFAQPPQPLLAAAGRCRAAPARARRSSSTQQGGEALLARKASRSGSARRAVGPGVELERQGEQQARDLEHAALAPARRLGRVRARPGARRAGCEVEGQQVGVLDHRHGVLDAGRDPERARRRNDVGAVRHRHRTTPVPRARSAPGMSVRHHPRLGAQVQQLGPHRALPVGANRCGVTGPTPCGGSRHWRISTIDALPNPTRPPATISAFCSAR